MTTKGLTMFLALLSTALPVAAPRRGVADDFDTIYETWFDFVWRSLRRLGVAESQIDDATQEVFIVVHRRLGDFEGRSSIKTWLFGITLRVASDMRRWNRRKNQHDPLTGDEPIAATDDAHQLTSRREAAQAIERCLGAIPEERRAVFVMMELEEMTAPEVAEAMSIPLNTVYSRLRLARADFERAAALIRRSNP